jgi:hypothetical protein
VCLGSSREAGPGRSTLTYVNRGGARALVVALSHDAFGPDIAAPVDLTARVE